MSKCHFLLYFFARLRGGVGQAIPHSLVYNNRLHSLNVELVGCSCSSGDARSYLGIAQVNTPVSMCVWGCMCAGVCMCAWGGGNSVGQYTPVQRVCMCVGVYNNFMLRLCVHVC